MSEAPTKTYTVADVLPAAPLRNTPRLKPLNGAADIEKLSYLDAEDKLAAADVLVNSLRKYGAQPTPTVRTAAHDPKGAKVKFDYGQAVYDLVDNTGDRRHTRGGTLLNLLAVRILRHVGDELLATSIAAGNGTSVPGFKPHHYALMDHPENEVWSDDQRLMLRWSKAVIDNTMTDDLWDQAVKAWGVKMTLRYIQFLGYFWAGGLRNRTLNMTYSTARDG